MIPKIFDLVNNKLVINENILTIPELRAVYNEYEPEVAMKAFMFLMHMSDPYGPYNNLSREEKEETLLHDFASDYSLEDDVIINALKKLETLYMSPTYRYYLDQKELLYRLGTYARSASVDDSKKDGNLTELLNMIKSVGKTITEFSILEKEAEKELQKMKIRGNRKQSYDEFEEDDD
jgi:hypothetical protein